MTIRDALLTARFCLRFTLLLTEAGWGPNYVYGRQFFYLKLFGFAPVILGLKAQER